MGLSWPENETGKSIKRRLESGWELAERKQLLRHTTAALPWPRCVVHNLAVWFAVSDQYLLSRKHVTSFLAFLEVITGQLCGIKRHGRSHTGSVRVGPQLSRDHAYSGVAFGLGLDEDQQETDSAAWEDKG